MPEEAKKPASDKVPDKTDIDRMTREQLKELLLKVLSGLPDVPKTVTPPASDKAAENSSAAADEAGILDFPDMWAACLYFRDRFNKGDKRRREFRITDSESLWEVVNQGIPCLRLVCRVSIDRSRLVQ